MRLNLGCGDHHLPGFENLDKSTGWTFEDGLPYGNDSVEAITISHSLMFVRAEDWPWVFAEIARVLVPGGVVRITEDSTGDRASERYGGHPDAVTLTTPELALRHLGQAGIPGREVAADESADPSLIQRWHGAVPKVFFCEAVKGGTKPRQRKAAQPVRISVIVPTIGRSTLGRALRSAEDADEILIDHNQDGDRGYAARERAIARATGTHLAFLDDDDAFTPGAIGLFREAAAQNPERVTIFKMRYSHGAELWKTEWLAFGNVGTPMLLVPNLPEKLGRWTPHPGGDTGGDYEFCSGCCEAMGAPVWRPEVVCIVRPN